MFLQMANLLLISLSQLAESEFNTVNALCEVLDGRNKFYPWTILVDTVEMK